MTPVKVSDLADKVVEIADKNPYVLYLERRQEDGLSADEGCLYSHGSRPGCLVGVAMHELGLPLKTLDDFDSGTKNGIRHIVYYHPEFFELDDQDDLEFLVKVQDNQDCGYTWRTSIDC